jgi:hypothetical protein
MNGAYEEVEIRGRVFGSERLTGRKDDDVSFRVERWTEAGYPPFLAAAAYPRKCPRLAVENANVGEQVLIARDAPAAAAARQIGRHRSKETNLPLPEILARVLLAFAARVITVVWDEARS